MTSEEKFNAAVNVIRNLPKNGAYQPSNELMLKFYSYYKQATEGPCLSPKPAFWELIKKAKWISWTRLGDMSRIEAMDNYVEELRKIVETMSYTENVANFIDSLDSFYETVPVEDLELIVGPVLKRMHSQKNVISNHFSAEPESIESSSQLEEKQNYSHQFCINQECSKHKIQSNRKNITERDFSNTLKPTSITTHQRFSKLFTNGFTKKSFTNCRNDKEMIKTVNTNLNFISGISSIFLFLQNDLDQIIIKLNVVEEKTLNLLKTLKDFHQGQSNITPWSLFRELQGLITFVALWPFITKFFILFRRHIRPLDS